MSMTQSKWPHFLHKSLVTNIASALFALAGYWLAQPVLLNIGLYAVSGAITNWLAIYMLFERVPGLYGTGVIPARFEEFKVGIFSLVMDQFFTAENFERFYQSTASNGERPHFNFEPIIEETDLHPSYEALLTVVMDSSFGSMLKMFGGAQMLKPMEEPFIAKMKKSLKEISQSDSFQESVHRRLAASSTNDEVRIKIETLVQKRLNELTPQLVKEIIQRMIRDHLGWLVVWGGVFGALIGLVAAFITP